MAGKKGVKPGTWNISYTYVKDLKEPPVSTTMRGIAYQSIRAMKKGTADTVTAEAVKRGFAKLTKQDHRTQIMIFMRQLADLGCVKIVQEPKAAAAPAKAPAAKTMKLKLKKAS